MSIVVKLHNFLPMKFNNFTVSYICTSLFRAPDPFHPNVDWENYSSVGPSRCLYVPCKGNSECFLFFILKATIFSVWILYVDLYGELLLAHVL